MMSHALFYHSGCSLPVFARRHGIQIVVTAQRIWIVINTPCKKYPPMLLCGNPRFCIMLPVSAPKCFQNAFNRHTAPALTLTTIRQQQRRVSNENKPPSKSTFVSSNNDNDRSTLEIPDFSKYSSKRNPRSNQIFSYFMAGSLGLTSAIGAKATVQGKTHIQRSLW